MEMKHIIKGVPDPSSDYIEIPDATTIIKMPMFGSAEADFVRKHGTDFHREMLDKTPLQNKNTRVIVTSIVQYLTPNVKPSIQRFGAEFPEGEWHVDNSASPLNDSDVSHLFISDSLARTEFNTKDVEVVLPEDIDFMTYRRAINELQHDIGIQPIKIESNRFYSFTNHIHRSISPPQPEFRFFFRVSETNDIKPCNEVKTYSSVYKDGKEINNIVQLKDHIAIYF